MDTLETLEKRTHSWPQSEREGLGRQFGIGWTALRYQGTASMEGLEFLYPFLNDSDPHVRRGALAAVGAIFHGTGPESLEKLSYVTENRDLFIRDRAALVVGRALAGHPAETILDVLRPSYTHKNDFIRGLGTVALGLAGGGQAHPSLFPIFEERIVDKSRFVARCAIAGLGEAFAHSGNAEALAVLEPLAPFPVPGAEVGQGRPWRSDHFRWRHAAIHHEAAAAAIARIGRGSPAGERAAALLRQYLHPENVPSGKGFEEQLTQRNGVVAMTWLLHGQPRRALDEMVFVLARPEADKPWMLRLPRSTAIWMLPGTFQDSGAEGVGAAVSLLAEEGHPTLRTGLLSLGVAARGCGDDADLATLNPFLSHGNGAVRDTAHLAAGLAFHKTARGDVLELLRTANTTDGRGPSTNYPLAVGLVCQGTGDGGVAAGLMELAALQRRRLTRHAALAVGLVHQGTTNPEAVETLLALLESGESDAACEALQLVDFDEDVLTRASWPGFPRCHGLADGPGVARMFVLKHFLAGPPIPERLGYSGL